MDALVGVEQQISNLIDDRDFRTIVGRFGKFNLFEALGAGRAELRHSNFLAFLLSPARPHGLGSEPLRRVLRAFAAEVPENERVVHSLEIAVANLESAIVYRERWSVDILIEIPEHKLVVAIENKIGAPEGGDQLSRYLKIVEEFYSGWRKIFIYLTPEGIAASNDRWISFNYGRLTNIFEEILKDSYVYKSPEIESIVRQYVDLIRRRVVEDNELKKLALNVYEKYKEAFDFVFDSRPKQENLLDCLFPLIEENENLEFDNKAKSEKFFFPKKFGDVFNLCSENQWTKTRRMLLFEIKNEILKETKQNRVTLSLIIGPGPQDIREKIYKFAKSDKSIFKNPTSSPGKIWTTIYKNRLLDQNISMNFDDDDARIEKIQNSFQEFLDRDLLQLERACLEIAESIGLK
ncbi:MAG TPA: PD-(D/E)XK nuclease family protein [Acidiphilium sp.]